MEQTAEKFGNNFSVINSDTVVSKAETSNYIIKVHGDFSAEFVLKEQDYLDYEKNYILIDNLLKTVFSTNLVLFVGYSLNDYNIRLILNWVKNVQKEYFITPVFIHTDKKLDDIELKYQENRGLKIIDCNDFIETDNQYLDRYKSVLDRILTYNIETELTVVEERIDYLFGKLIKIKNLDYIRKEDFNSIFDKKYALNNEWVIQYISGGKKINEFDNDIYNDKLSYILDF